MSVCELRPEDKKAFIGAVGEELVSCQGKQNYYKPEEISRAASTRGYPIDIHCWAYCFFSSPTDFRAVHAHTGQACDYTAMKAELLTALSDDTPFQLADFNLSWLEWPDIDLSSHFDWS